MTSYESVGIIVNLKKKTAASLVPKLRGWLKKRGLKVFDSLKQSRAKVLERSDFVMCLGGDGTLLSVARLMQKKSVPILGVNLGYLGFLTEVKQEEIFDELEAFLQGKSLIEKRLMLKCTARNRHKGSSKKFIALNDMVISREGLSRLVQLEVSISGEKLTSFTGDGVIIATPTGSTAYSLSAGASVVHPKLEAIVVTPICPHASSLRSIVVSSDEKIVVQVKSKGEFRKALLTADGQENFEIDDSYIVEITKAEAYLKLIKSSRRSYFSTLREIFKFPA